MIFSNGFFLLLLGLELRMSRPSETKVFFSDTFPVIRLWLLPSHPCYSFWIFLIQKGLRKTLLFHTASSLILLTKISSSTFNFAGAWGIGRLCRRWLFEAFASKVLLLFFEELMELFLVSSFYSDLNFLGFGFRVNNVI